MGKVTNIRKADTTTAFTYEVKMVIQILASDEKTAREQLDTQGGFVTKRDVKLLDSVDLCNGKEN